MCATRAPVIDVSFPDKFIGSQKASLEGTSGINLAWETAQSRQAGPAPVLLNLNCV